MQTFFPLTPAKISNDAGASWGDINITAFGAPNGASGAVVYIHNIDASARHWGIRKKGSTDAREAEMSGDSHCWGIVGVDENGKLQFYNVYAFPGKVEMYLVGYTIPAGVTMLTNGVAIAPPGLSAWGDIDLSATLPAGAAGAVIEVHGTGAYGLRQKGSTDARINIAANSKNQFTTVIGCDASRLIEGYKVAGITFYLLGYITDGVTFNLNAIDITPKVGAWRDLAPIDGGMGNIAGTGGGKLNLRRKGETQPSATNAYVVSHAWAITGANPVAPSIGYMQGYCELATARFFLVGWATVPVLTGKHYGLGKYKVQVA